MEQHQVRKDPGAEREAQHSPNSKYEFSPSKLLKALIFAFLLPLAALFVLRYVFGVGS